MLRARRYRAILIFTSVFVLAFFYFARSRDWPASSTPPVVDRPPFPHDPPAAGSKEAAATPLSQNIPENPSLTNPEIAGAPASKNRPEYEHAPVYGSTASQIPTKPFEDQVKQDGKVISDTKPGHLDAEKPVLASDEGPVYWKKPTEQFPLAPADIIKLPTSRSKTLPKLQARMKDESSEDKLQRLQKLASVKRAFEHAWSGYKTAAMGHDEVKPLRGGYKDPFMGWGATLVDTLDTLWIMDLKEEFAMAVDEIKKIDFTTSPRRDIPVFETTIRYVGGLLGAYDISGHKYPELLKKATELADILIGVFDTPNRMPMLFYYWKPARMALPHMADRKAVLAEIGSLSMEFTRLAQLTRQDKYYDAIARVTTELEKYQTETKLPGLWPLELDAAGCEPVTSHIIPEARRDDVPSIPTPVYSASPSPAFKNLVPRGGRGGISEDAQPANYEEMEEVTTLGEASRQVISSVNCKGGLKNMRTGTGHFGLGALGDSTYEYLPKEYMLLGGLNEQYRTMYEKAMDATREHLLFQPMIKEDRDVRFLANVRPLSRADPESSKLSYEYEGSHLACFAGGMFGVGAKIFEIAGDLDIAAQLTEGCVWAYESTTTGIMPEKFLLVPCKKGEPCTWNEAEYRRALDPHEDERIARAARLNEMKLKSAKQPQNREADAVPTLQPSFPARGYRGSPIEKRDEVEKRWHVIATPTPTSTPTPTPTPEAHDGEIADRGASPPTKVSALSHDEFVDGRIKDERLPPGMVAIPLRKYLLRPEAIESVFIMFRLTGDDYWRQKGWKMFEAVAKYTQTELAHTSIDDVTSTNPQPLDNMESFWLAETLKYFYLLFSDPSVVNLDEYVLNTEAHPFKRPEY